MKYKWRFNPNPPVGGLEVAQGKIRNIAKGLDIPISLATVLVNRGLDNRKSIEKFFNPKVDDLYDPFLMQDMHKAVERLLEAILKKEKVVVFGDYDVDGITATSLLYLFLNEIGLDTIYYIPDREIEGYGLSEKGIKFAAKSNASLLLTCDCGINAFKEIEYANAKGIDVIITDHHEPPASPPLVGAGWDELLPNAFAVLDPKRVDNSYPFTELCGVGVAFKLLQALSIKNHIPSQKLMQHLDLVAIGTAADIVPIIDENRIMVAKGLGVLNRAERVGIKSLLKVAGFENKQMDVVNIVFGLAPRLNAAGRLGSAIRSVRLLTSFDERESIQIANILERENRNRQNIEKNTLNEAILQLNATHDLEKDKIFVLGDKNWHQGVIGIAASKLKDIYNRPVVMVSFRNSPAGGKGKGSARSIPGFDIYSALRECSDILETYGGHKMAAGLTISIGKLPEFTNRLKELAEEWITDEMLEPCLEIESEITFNDINQKTFDILKKIAPFGPGNMRPTFFARNLEVSGIPRIVGENHLKFKVSQGKSASRRISAIGWKLGELYEMLISSRPLEMAFVIEENEWNGIKEIQLNVKDIDYSS